MTPIYLELVEVFEPITGLVKIFHLCEMADANQPFEWWISKDGKHHALFHPDAYYDDKLRERRNSNNMICQKDKRQRLILVGHIARQIDLDPSSYVELFRSRFQLESVTINEK